MNWEKCYQVSLLYTVHLISAPAKQRQFLALLNALIEQNVAMIGVARVFARRTVARLQGGLRNLLNIVIIERQPVVTAFNLAYIVSLVGATPEVDYHSKEGVLAIYIVRGTAQLQLHGVYHSVWQFLVPIQLFNELEAL